MSTAISLPGIKARRIFLARLFTETNTFVDQPTSLEAFSIRRGNQLFLARGEHSPMDGFLKTADSLGWSVVPGVCYRAAPGGIVKNEVFEQFWQEFLSAFLRALATGLDGIFLILHGAMVTETYSDAEGEFLSRIRSVPGAENLPIVAVLDLHANVSEQMARKASALIPYRENPHTDARETAVRAAGLLSRAFEGGCILRNHYRHSGILLAPPATGTAEDPVRSLEALARELEVSDNHWEIAVAPGFAHADVPDAGLTFWIVGPDDGRVYEATLERLCLLAHSLKAAVKDHEVELSVALDHIQREKQFPALLVEPADNIGGGGPGDMTFVLRALLTLPPIGPCGVIINDPQAVQVLRALEIGQDTHLSLGGRGSRFDLGPVDLEVTLVNLSNGCFELADKQSHLAGAVGSNINMGPTAVVTRGQLTILITSVKTPPFDLGQWTSQGVDPSKFAIIGVKAAVGHRRAYDPITGSSYSVVTPGPCSSSLQSLPYEKLQWDRFPGD